MENSNGCVSGRSCIITVAPVDPRWTRRLPVGRPVAVWLFVSFVFLLDCRGRASPMTRPPTTACLQTGSAESQRSQTDMQQVITGNITTVSRCVSMTQTFSMVKNRTLCWQYNPNNCTSHLLKNHIQRAAVEIQSAPHAPRIDVTESWSGRWLPGVMDTK